MNNIKSIAVDFSNLTNLEYLILSRNRITSIPEEITILENLKHLDIRLNRLAGITPSILKLKNLEVMLLSHNLLGDLPSELSAMEMHLRILDIYNNPFPSLPNDVIPNPGAIHLSELTALLAYLRSIQARGNSEYNRVKVMFVGDGNVGKTYVYIYIYIYFFSYFNV